MTEVICDVKPNMLHSPSSGDVRKEAETLKSDITSLQQQIDNTDDFELRRQLRARVKQKRERLKELGEDDYIAPSLGRDMTSPSRQTSLLVRKMQDSIITKQQGQGQGVSPSSAGVSKATVGRSQSLLVRKTCAADVLSPPVMPAGGGSGRMGLIFKELYAKDRSPLPEFRHMPPASPPPSFTNPFRSRAALQRRQSQDATSSPSTLMTSSSSPALPVGCDLTPASGVAATLVRPLADMRAEDGTSGTFSCRCRPPPNASASDPLPTVTWVKDGHALTISDDQFVQTVQREANNDISVSLVIREIFPDDEGQFTCTITAVAWQLTSTARLTVLDYETMIREKNKKMTNGASPCHTTNDHHDANCKSDVNGSANHNDDSKVKVEPRAAAKPVPRGAMRAFSMDAAASTPTGTGATKPGVVTATGGGVKVSRVVQRSQSDIKQMLLNWIQAQTKEYTNIDIKNFSTCWTDGLAFCALIHHFYPDAFDYSKLDSKNPEKNFQLAFDTAEKRAGIAPLLDVEDMMKMRTNPDWKCIFVYVQSFYRRFYRQTVAKSGSGEGSEGPSTPTTPHTPISSSGSTSSEH